MGIRDSFTRLKKKLKNLGRKRKPGRTEGEVHGDSVDPANPLPRPEPQIEAGNEEWNGASAHGQQASSTDQAPQQNEPEPVPANGSENDQGGGVAGIDGVYQTHSHPHPGFKVAVESGPSREGNDAKGERVEKVYTQSSTPIPRGSKSDGM